MNNQNIEDKTLTTLAFVIGLALIDNLSSTEQNAVGNWLMLVAQVLSTNAFYRAVMQERGLEPKESTETGRNNADTFSGSSSNSSPSDTPDNETVVMLEKMVRAMQTEIDNIKRNMNL